MLLIPVQVGIPSVNVFVLKKEHVEYSNNNYDFNFFENYLIQATPLKVGSEMITWGTTFQNL
jgi:hypothetical protein